MNDETVYADLSWDLFVLFKMYLNICGLDLIGKPAPSVTWKRGGTGEIEGNVRTSRIGDTTASILTLHPLQREHHLAEFICESANDEITYHTTQLRLELNRKYLSLSTKFLTVDSFAISSQWNS